jgi:hypothetical protein
MSKLRYMFVCILIPYVTFAQIGSSHGTIVITNVTKDEIVFAADSLAKRPFGPDYSYCKIVALQHQVIFAGVGYLAYKSAMFDPVPAFDGREIAGRAVVANGIGLPGMNHMERIAKVWADEMSTHLELLYRWHPEEILGVIRLNGGTKGEIASAQFAEIEDGKIRQTSVAITLRQENLSQPIWWAIGPLAGCWVCGQSSEAGLCASGRSAIAQAICTKATARPELELRLDYSPTLKQQGWDDPSLLALRIADLTVAYDISGEVGGRIDVVRLKSDGSIEWLARKDNCRERDY